MRASNVGEAMGGPWAFSLTGWLALFAPSAALVILQESGTSFPNFGYVLASAVLQHLAGGLIVLPAALVLRRRSRPLPLWSSISTWTAIGVARGLIGGVMESVFADTSPNFPLRLSVWLLASWVWIPLYTYMAAERQSRRDVLSALKTAVNRRDDARELQGRSAEEIRQQLLTAVQTTVEGVIEDVRLSLAAARTSLDPAQFQLVGARVASVSRQAGRVVSNMTQSVADKPGRVPQLGAPLKFAHMFERRRPWLWSSLAIAAIAAVLAPMCFRHGGWLLFGEFVAAMALATFVLALGPGVAQRGLRHLPGQAAWAFARYSVAGCSGALLLAALRWGRWDSFTISVTLVLPYVIAFSATVVSGAVGLVAANRRALSSLVAIEAERAELEATARDQESSIRDQLAELLHGPVLGRLSACAMALNFHAAELGTAPRERTEQVTSAVLKHLDAAATDLNALIR